MGTTEVKNISTLSRDRHCMKVDHEVFKYEIEGKGIEDNHSYCAYLYHCDDKALCWDEEEKEDLVRKLRGLNSIIVSSIMALEGYNPCEKEVKIDG